MDCGRFAISGGRLRMVTSDIILLAVGAFIAVATLVRLMRTRRDQLIGQFRTEMTAEIQRQKQLEKAERQRQQAQAAKK
jgi:hypothetical protein